MKRSFRWLIALCLALLPIGAVAWAQAAGGAPAQKENKVTSQQADILGSLTGAGRFQEPATVELLRRDGTELIPVAKAQTKENGDFMFATVAPGEYIVRPVLATLPEGMGLYKRLEFVVVHNEPVRVTLNLGRVHKLVTNQSEFVLLSADDSVYIETAAYDEREQYLFASSKIDVPAGVETSEASENGLRLKLGAGMKEAQVKAHAGPNAVNVSVKHP